MLKKILKRPPLRKPDVEETTPDEAEEDHDSEESEKLREVRERQKMREKPRGLDVGELNAGLKLLPSQEENIVDPFKTLAGGLVDRNVLKKRIDMADDAYDTGIGTTFSAETNLRDEDDEMRRFIETEVAKRTGKLKDEAGSANEEPKFLSPEDAALRALPENLKNVQSNWSGKNEEMLSSQMLSGIPEVDLGMESKIKNIEATESAKNRILLDRMKKKDLPSEFVPTNIAVNFVQHNRYNLDDGSSNLHKKSRQPPDGRQKGRNDSAAAAAASKAREAQKKRPLEQKVVVGVDGEAAVVTELRAPKRPGEERATDDFAYERFKKQFKKH